MRWLVLLAEAVRDLGEAGEFGGEAVEEVVRSGRHGGCDYVR